MKCGRNKKPDLLGGPEHARHGALATSRANLPDDDDARHLSSRPPIDRPAQTKTSQLLSAAVLAFANIEQVNMQLTRLAVTSVNPRTLPPARTIIVT